MSGRRLQSQSLEFRVKKINLEQSLPEIIQAINGELDVGALTQDATLSVSRWEGKVPGQLLYLRFEGVLPNSAAYAWSHPVWQGFPVSDANLEQTTVALAELRKLNPGTNLRVILELSIDNGQSRIPFPVVTYRLRQVLLGENFEQARAQRIYAIGAQMEAPSMVIKMISSQDVNNAYAAIERMESTGAGSGMSLLINQSPHGGVTPNRRMIVQLNLHDEYSAIRFGWSHAHVAGTVQFLSAAGAVLETVTAQGGVQAQYVSSRLHTLTKIKAMLINVKDAINLDNFTFTR